jgi:hypothetical protein
MKHEAPNREISDSLRRVVLALIYTSTIRSATIYVSPTLSVKATRKFRSRKNEASAEMVLTIGRPNYEGRAFVKKCKAAKEPFPIKRIQFRFWPQK